MDGDGTLLVSQRLVHGAVKVVGRVQMGAVMGRQIHQLHRPAFAIGQVFLFQAGKKRLNLLESVFVGEVLDLWRESRRV